MRIEKKIVIDIDIDTFVKDLIAYGRLKNDFLILTDLTEKDFEYLDSKEFYYQVGKAFIKISEQKMLDK